MEYKSLTLELSTVSKEGQFQGYAATFGNVDLGGDVIAPGAFANSLVQSGGKLPILDHHNPDRQIGWNLSAHEDDHGLYVFGQLDLNVQSARERHSLMRMAHDVGGKTGLSIGFNTLQSELDADDLSIRHLLEVELMEYSLVTFPMNPSAQVTAVKKGPSLPAMLAEFHRNLVTSNYI